MLLLRNVGLFFVVFLPAAAIAGMLVEAWLVEPAPGWEVGWNPVLALVLTAPWLAPAVLVVPLLHWLAAALAARFSRRTARAALLGASPALFLATVGVLWGPQNFRLELGLPVAAAGLAFGGVLRIATRPSRS